jgi:2,4-dienoyl-CoA reductase-like NADH-dependent reductase (Old Yellow Enzyme family)/thioredoxin reductase
MALTHLFSPGSIGSLVLKNRIILPAMGSGLPEKEGYVSKRLIDFHVARAMGGCGLNIVENSAVAKETKGPYVLAIYDDRFIPGLLELTGKIREAGGKSCLQIWHAGRQLRSSLSGYPLLAPSPIPCPVCKEMPKELSGEEISQLVTAYAMAAVRAKKAGFDAIEVHGAHGYLIAQFLSASSNQRSDLYGGPLVNRARFAVEIIKEIRTRCGRDYPIIFRLSVEERIEAGLTVNDAEVIAALMEAAGVDAIHVSMGTYATMQYVIPPMDLPLAFNVGKGEPRKRAMKIPVIMAGRVNDPVVAERILAEGRTDFVSVGRGQLADQEFSNKAQRGDFDSIVKCIGCNQGCVDRRLYHMEPMSCLRNPGCGREAAYRLIPTETSRRVLVVGGGPGGLEVAVTLKRRGHDVLLCEKSDRLGGAFYLGGAAPRKGEIKDAVLQMGMTAIKEGVEVKLGIEVTPEMIERINPDVMIVATGSKPIVPTIPGVLKSHVMTASDVLSGKGIVGDKVAVVGGGLVGVELAELLSEQGKKVTIIEMLPQLAGDMGGTRRVFSLRSLKARGVRIITGAQCKEILDRGVVVERSGAEEEIDDIDSVILALGAISENTLVDYLEKTDREYQVIGDALKPRKALDAIWEAAEVGRRI